MQVRAAHHQCGLNNLNVSGKSRATPIKMCSIRSSLHNGGQCCITWPAKAAKTNGSCICVLFHLTIKTHSQRESYHGVLINFRLHNETIEPYLEK